MTSIAVPVTWPITALRATPSVQSCPERQAPGLHSLLFSGVSWRGCETRVFAWLGLPTGRERGLPGMVLVHGGLGSAEAEWVRLWNRRGYAAIAIDTCGCLPSAGAGDGHQRHAYGGPPGWGGFDQADEPRDDQWLYHAVAAVIQARSLLAVHDRVESRHIGLTGLSWGGIIAAIAGAHEPRFACVAPVYGFGFLERSTDSGTANRLANLSLASRRRWLNTWNPARHLSRLRRPSLWINGSNDFAFPLDAWEDALRRCAGPLTRCIVPGLAHGQDHGASPAEIHAFADGVFERGLPLAQLRGQGRRGRRVWLEFSSRRPVIRATLHSTVDRGSWAQRRWNAQEASCDHRGRVDATLPAEATAWFINLGHDGNLIVSSACQELP